MKNQVAIVIAAAGSGKRLPGAVPKQWRPLGGDPLIAHTFRFFDRFPLTGQIALALDKMTLSLPDRTKHLESTHHKKVIMVEGGDNRQESVWKALQALDKETEIVLIHDAARPFPPADAVSSCINAARKHGGALLACPVVETVKRVDKEGRIQETLKREELVAAQTPQGFRYPELMEAYGAAEKDLRLFTDDSSIFEANGGQVYIVPGSPTNFKVTLPEDFFRAEQVIRRSHMGKPA